MSATNDNTDQQAYYDRRMGLINNLFSLSEEMFLGSDGKSCVTNLVNGRDILNVSSLNLIPKGRRQTLDFLTSPYRAEHPLDKWSMYEMVLFEAAICYHGKDFSKIAEHISTKSVQDCVNFYYYVWKRTARYYEWKAERDNIFLMNEDEQLKEEKKKDDKKVGK